MIYKNELAYNPARLNVGSIGLFKDEKGIISSLYVCFKCKRIILPKYLFNFIKTNKFNKNILKTQEGGVRSYFFFDKLEKSKIYLPNLDEQQKVVNFLTKIDERIDTQSKIIKDLILQINYIKNKLFSTYINLYSKHQEYSFNELFLAYKKLNTLHLQQYTIGKNGIKFIDNEPIYSTKSHIIFEPNTLILGIGIEEIGISIDITGCCSPIYKTYRINNSIVNTLFFYYFAINYFSLIKKYITRKSTRRNFEFDYKELSNITFKLPSIETQKKDANCIKKLYIKLKNEQDILELYKKQKAYLLQNMFI